VPGNVSTIDPALSCNFQSEEPNGLPANVSTIDPDECSLSSNF
jgi:hypothetical protein